MSDSQWHLCDFKKCRKIYASKRDLANHKKAHSSRRKISLSLLKRNTIFNSTISSANSEMETETSQSQAVTTNPSPLPKKSTRNRNLIEVSQSGISSGRKSGGRRRNSETPVSCQLCLKSFNRREYLRRHLLVVHGPEKEDEKCTCKPCNFCARKVLRKPLLHHEDEHESEEEPSLQLSLSCNLCNKIFSSISLKNRHMMAHKGYGN